MGTWDMGLGFRHTLVPAFPGWEKLAVRPWMYDLTTLHRCFLNYEKVIIVYCLHNIENHLQTGSGTYRLLQKYDTLHRTAGRS